jgi:hypothetical protein
LPERDAALLLDMLFAARDAQAFVEGDDHRLDFRGRRLLSRCTRET